MLGPGIPTQAPRRAALLDEHSPALKSGPHHALHIHCQAMPGHLGLAREGQLACPATAVARRLPQLWRQGNSAISK
eukprot:5563738-Alexandrium_andersonii.AAC.1